MTHSNEVGAQDRLRLKAEAARVLYDSLTLVLKSRVAQLNASAEGTDVLPKELIAEINNHHKALTALIEKEVTLDAARPDARCRSDIDLAAARDELIARLLELRK
ncbi:hypothetical protein [Pontivivens insulae]|uniref:Uncharacterized protein n=1 Tax=Pontivivens insulae TaxID=1639689 RepID=A0A2R8AAA7_9RHOB|nr:hypothetical protein [Pontivivens insulae]RED13075.1 hypothetical protein DFR53_2210 [Pontivivens insulae]SPF29167.1 hypothetical protein POI8812_01474 [Pontivivens insulae]